MGRAGLLVIILGIAGLFAHLVVTVPPKSADAVAGGSWVAVGIGAVLLLTAIAQNGYGYGVFLLALGVGGLVADRITHFTAFMRDSQPLFGILVTLLIGVGAIAVSYADGVEGAGVRLLFFAVASLASDIFVDFGAGWDDLVNLSTAFFAAAFVVTAVVILRDDDLLSFGAVTDYYGDLLLLAAGIGTGAAVVLVTTVTTFDLAGFVEFLLTAAAVACSYLVVPLLGFFLLLGLADDDASGNVVGEAIDTMDQGPAALGSLVAGLVVVAAMVALVFGGPPGWLVAVLVVVAVAAAGAAALWGSRALTELAGLIRSGALPGRIAEVLDELCQGDPVFRLLPGAGRLSSD